MYLLWDRATGEPSCGGAEVMNVAVQATEAGTHYLDLSVSPSRAAILGETNLSAGVFQPLTEVVPEFGTTARGIGIDAAPCGVSREIA